MEFLVVSLTGSKVAYSSGSGCSTLDDGRAASRSLAGLGIFDRDTRNHTSGNFFLRLS